MKVIICALVYALPFPALTFALCPRSVLTRQCQLIPHTTVPERLQPVNVRCINTTVCHFMCPPYLYMITLLLCILSHTHTHQVISFKYSAGDSIIHNNNNKKKTQHHTHTKTRKTRKQSHRRLCVANKDCWKC